ncbi:hypothetical protein BV898_17974 [Hypsibius exemplaris]|uniref:Tyr recombinase domain-containing protein n=1 Tax=Hypsibius exemplaris TaxID=2072580 RepID=A0A9X6NIY8_HYPEX|nr:hypothetical protein BV898_17974 [Hypsibius exemplaris]
MSRRYYHSKLSFVTYSKIKTSRFKGGTFDIPLPRLDEQSFCPTLSVLSLLKASQLMPPKSPLLSTIHNGSRQPYTAQMFSTTLKHLLKTAGYEPQHFSIHSFRRGAATFAAASGISEDVIRAQGTWRSSCYKRYIDRDVEQRQQFANQVKEAVFPHPLLTRFWEFWGFVAVPRPGFTFGINDANKE